MLKQQYSMCLYLANHKMYILFLYHNIHLSVLIDRFYLIQNLNNSLRITTIDSSSIEYIPIDHNLQQQQNFSNLKSKYHFQKTAIYHQSPIKFAKIFLVYYIKKIDFHR